MESLTPPNGNYEEIIYDLVFAYANKDEYPHSFEIEALENAKKVLTNPYHISFVDSVLEVIYENI